MLFMYPEFSYLYLQSEKVALKLVCRNLAVISNLNVSEICRFSPPAILLLRTYFSNRYSVCVDKQTNKSFILKKIEQPN